MRLLLALLMLAGPGWAETAASVPVSPQKISWERFRSEHPDAAKKYRECGIDAKAWESLNDTTQRSIVASDLTPAEAFRARNAYESLEDWRKNPGRRYQDSPVLEDMQLYLDASLMAAVEIAAP